MVGGGIGNWGRSWFSIVRFFCNIAIRSANESVVSHNSMTRNFLTFLLILKATVTLSQTNNFSKTVQELYFNINPIDSNINVIDTLSSIKYLQRFDSVSCKCSALSNILFNTNEDIKRCNYTFFFTQSPISNLKIDTGFIEVIVGEFEGFQKIIGTDWHIQFDNKKEASIYFEMLTKLFLNLSTKNKLQNDKANTKQLAEFSTRELPQTKIKDISITLYPSLRSGKYEIQMTLYNRFSFE